MLSDLSLGSPVSRILHSHFLKLLNVDSTPYIYRFTRFFYYSLLNRVAELFTTALMGFCP